MHPNSNPESASGTSSSAVRQDVFIRPATRDDIPFIEGIYELVEATGAPHWRQDGPSPYTTDWIEQLIANAPADQVLLVAEDQQQQRLGYTWALSLVDFDTIDPHGHIAGVGVAPAAEGRGIGSLLVAAAEDWCRRQGLREVTLHCYIANERAHRLYERLGFEDEWHHMRKALD